MLHAVIMAGGGGTRFWPLGRQERPKQFLPLLSDETLLQQTAARCSAIMPAPELWVVTNARYADETLRELPQMPREHLLAEPCGRNTAPCIGLAALRLLHEDPEAVMLVLPADHAIDPAMDFAACVHEATGVVARNPQAMVLMGAVPTEPVTGFGYIERAAAVAQDAIPPVAGSRQVFRVAAFHEKPTRDVAITFVASGQHYWNCGIFVWRADRIVALIEQHLPELASGLRRIAAAFGPPGTDGAHAQEILQKEFPTLPAVSIDQGVIERASEVYALAATFQWADVGTWQSLSRHLGTDARGNTVIGPHIGIDTEGCVIRTAAGHLIATIGLTNCIIVHTPDATLIARKDDEAGLRRLVGELESRGFGGFA